MREDVEYVTAPFIGWERSKVCRDNRPQMAPVVTICMKMKTKAFQNRSICRLRHISDNLFLYSPFWKLCDAFLSWHYAVFIFGVLGAVKDSYPREPLQTKLPWNVITRCTLHLLIAVVEISSRVNIDKQCLVVKWTFTFWISSMCRSIHNVHERSSNYAWSTDGKGSIKDSIKKANADCLVRIIQL